MSPQSAKNNGDKVKSHLIGIRSILKNMVRGKSSTSSEDAIVKQLRIIARLLIEQQIKAKIMTMNDTILLLDSMGLGPTQIGDIIGWSASSVGGKLTQLKKAKKK